MSHNIDEGRSERPQGLERAERFRWPNGIHCPSCASTLVSSDAGGVGSHKCKRCRRGFTVLTGTPFQHATLTFLDWLVAADILASEPLDLAERRVCDRLGITWKSARFMIERLKTASQKGGVSKIFGSSYQRKLSKVFQRSVRPRRLSSRDNRSHKATSRDVAQLAGVSLSAVSRAYTPGRSVSREAREKIQKAADRLGYKPNAIARMLITRRRDIIGCVVGDLTNFFLSSVLDRLTLELQNRSFLPLLFRVQGTEDLDKVLPAILEYQVGAVVLTRFAPSRVATELCQKAGVPFIIMNLEVGRADNTIRISCDHEAGGRLAASALIADGHQRIAYIAGIPGLSNNEDRKRGFLSRLADDGRMAWSVGEGGRTYEAGYAAAAKMLGTSQRPDAIFCNNDMLAIGALDAARQLYGLSVPDDVAILGFDDVPIASWRAYNLSTIRQPVESMVAATTSLIESLPRSAAQENSVHLFPAELVRRGTTRGENSAAKQRISTVSSIILRSE